MQEPLEEAVFGRYRLLEQIGEGAMGQVFKAHDSVIDRNVAIKLLSAELRAVAGYRERFRREAYVAARLTEPHIIPIHDAGEIDGQLYLVMPLVDALDLHRFLRRRGPMSPRLAVRVIEQLAAALDAAHGAGLVHRDVKPSNALITKNEFVYLIDFGIAHDTTADKLTRTGAMLGTFAYMAPERFSGKADARSDVYALTCVLHECLTGQQPYPGSGLEAQIAAHLTEEPPRPSSSNPAIPAGFDEVIARGMARDPKRRYQTAHELAVGAQAALASAGPPAMEAPVQEQPSCADGAASAAAPATRADPTVTKQTVDDRTRRIPHARGNLRRHSPAFVGRAAELRALRAQLTGDALGVVTAVHGLGGMGKTELAVTYAHSYADAYLGGTWQVDADGQTDMLEAVSALALWPELGLEVGQEHLANRRWLGRRVLARLQQLTETAAADEPDTAACLLLLDNVSDAQLLAASQLAVLPDEPWLHLLITTRLGPEEIGGVGARGSVRMIEVGRLDAADAWALIREYQPVRDPVRGPDFSSPEEGQAARAIVELLDGYTLAVEQAAVYLGGFGVQPSDLLAVLRAQGTAVLDDVGRSPQGARAMLHKEKLAGAIVDQTLHRLAQRARAALAIAGLLPPDRVPWEWLQQLTEPASSPESSERMKPPTGLRGLAGLTGGADWGATRRSLDGTRLLTPTDDPRFARLHRVLHAHLRTHLTDPQAEQRLDTHLQTMSANLQAAAVPDTGLLAITATTLSTRLGEDLQLADAARGLGDEVRQRLDLPTAENLITATLEAYEALVAADPDNRKYQTGLSSTINRMGAVREARGDAEGALVHYNRALQIAERLAAADPDSAVYQRNLAAVLSKVGDLTRDAHGDVQAALEHYTRTMRICERLATVVPAEARDQRNLSIALTRLAELQIRRRDAQAALDNSTQALQNFERLAAAHPGVTLYQYAIAHAFSLLGDIAAIEGDAQAELEHQTRALEICERLAATDPDNTLYRRGWSVALYTVGDLLAAQGDSQSALAHYTRSLEIAERLAAADPDNAERQRELFPILIKEGDMRTAGGEAQVALEQYTRALQIAQQLATGDPNHTAHQRDLGVSAAKVASALQSVGDMSAADYWVKAHRALRSLDAAGTLADADRSFLDDAVEACQSANAESHNDLAEDQA